MERIFDNKFGECFKMNEFKQFLLGNPVQKKNVYAGLSSTIHNKRPAEIKDEEESEPKRKKYAKDFVTNFKDEVFDVSDLFLIISNWNKTIRFFFPAVGRSKAIYLLVPISLFENCLLFFAVDDCNDNNPSTVVN